MPSEIFAGMSEIIRPKINVDYQFFVIDEPDNLDIQGRFWQVAGFTDEEVELFIDILTNRSGETYHVTLDLEFPAKMLKNYGVISLQELVNPYELLATPTRIGILLYEYSQLRDMRTICEYDSSSKGYAGKIFIPEHVRKNIAMTQLG